ncbi:MAG TPA: response regulator [Candidatus Binatia bacterium]|nr:response regulator [Candidatus Binatia bacterium]
MTDSSNLIVVPRPSPQRAKILIVDDTDSNRVAFHSILEAPHHEIIQAKDGLEALEFIIDNDFAVILLDIRMPRMGGLETAQNIRARKRSRYTPILFLSAYESTPVEVSKGFVIGGVIDYLFSPVDSDMLRNKVNFLTDFYLRNQEANRELRELREHCQVQEIRIRELQMLLATPLKQPK